MNSAVETLVAKHLNDSAVAWSLGSFGAIAEFMRLDDEVNGPSLGNPLSLVTTRGAILIDGPDDIECVAYETPSRHPEQRQRGIAFCLPRERCRMARRTVVTEIGADHEVLRAQDREATLFDMGLAQINVDVMVRSADPETIGVLRAGVGRSLFDPTQTLMRDLPRLSPHRVFASRCGRIEVFQAIPSVEGRSPDGPHTHVLPELLRFERSTPPTSRSQMGLCRASTLISPNPIRTMRSSTDASAAASSLE